MIDVLSSSHLPPHSVALGSVKSNLGHLKGAAGAAGLLKAALALRDKVLPPSVHCEHRNPNIDFAHSPLYVNTELKPWTMPADSVRRAGLSAFGFGGTNFHAVLEEYIPHRLNGNGNGKRSVAVSEPPTTVKESIMNTQDVSRTSNASPYKAPLRGALVIGAASEAALDRAFARSGERCQSRQGTGATAPAESDLRAPERVAIDYSDATRTGEQSGQRTQSAGRQSARSVESSACPRHLPRSRSGSQGGVPVYRSRLAVREHAQAASSNGADCGRNFCRGRSHHDAPARQAARANSSSLTTTTPTRLPRPKKICAKPRLLSPPCSPSTSP